MSIGNALAILGAGMGGYMRGVQQKRDADAEQADIDFKKWQREQMQAQQARDDQTRTDVAAAAAPVSMQSIMAKPSTMDDRDVGQPGEAPVAVNTFKVGAQSFTDQGQATKALGDANSPIGTSQRVAAAYMKNAQPTMAMAMQRDAQQAELARLGLDEAHQRAASEMYDRALGKLGTHDAIAGYVSNANGDGEGGALKLKAVPSADGKSITYNRVNEDGTLTPTGQTFSNDNAGVLKAQEWLSRNTPLSAKIANLHQQEVLDRQSTRDQQEAEWRKSQVAEESRHNKAMEGYAAITAGARATKASAFDKLDEGVKMQYKGAQEAEKAASQAITEGLAKGTLDPNSPAYATLQGNIAAARKQRLGIEMRNGLIEAADVADGITRDETDPAKITTGVQQAYALGGKEFGDQVKKAAQPALDALTTKAKVGPPAPAATARPSMAAIAAQRIPDPPPATTQQGLSMVPNPAFATWNAQFGAAYQQQRARDAAAASAAADAAKATYNPYMQNQVR